MVALCVCYVLVTGIAVSVCLGVGNVKYFLSSFAFLLFCAYRSDSPVVGLLMYCMHRLGENMFGLFSCCPIPPCMREADNVAFCLHLSAGGLRQ